MSTKTAAAAARPIPEGFRTVTPHLICAGAAAAIDFYKKAFGAIEELRVVGPSGKLVHARIRIGDSAVMLMDEFPDWQTFGPQGKVNSPVFVHLYVEDVDAFVARAVAAGAQIAHPFEDTFWGDRYGALKDPFGHQWAVATHLRDMNQEEIQQAALKMFGG